MDQEMRPKGKLKTFITLPVWLTILFAGLAVWMCFMNLTAGLLCVVFVIIYFVVIFAVYHRNNHFLLNEMVDFAMRYGTVQRRLLDEFEIPFAIIDDNTCLLWMNQRFSEVTGKDRRSHSSVSAIFPEITKERIASDEHIDLQVERDGKVFRASVRKMLFPDIADESTDADMSDMGGETIILIYLFDENGQVRSANDAQEDSKAVLSDGKQGGVPENLGNVEQSQLISLGERKVNRTARVRARVKALALREIMVTRDRFFVMGHHIADVDSLGAAIGIYCAARQLGKKAQIVLDTVTTSLRPFVEGFSPVNGYPDDLFLSSAMALEAVDMTSALIVVDTNRPSYTACPELLERAGSVVVFDHHRSGGEAIQNASLSYIEPYASSSCEMIAEVLQYFDEDIHLSNTEADVLYAGILLDTNNFVTKTGVRTFETAAYLRRCGAETVRVRKLMQNDMADYKARADAILHAEVYHGNYAISVCPTDNIESPTVTCAQAANELLNIIGIKASFVLTEYKNRIYISARSIDDINVQRIMERLGGGGHMNSAGAQLTECTLCQAKQTIVNMIDETIEGEKDRI